MYDAELLADCITQHDPLKANLVIQNIVGKKHAFIA